MGNWLSASSAPSSDESNQSARSPGSEVEGDAVSDGQPSNADDVPAAGDGYPINDLSHSDASGSGASGIDSAEIAGFKLSRPSLVRRLTRVQREVLKMGALVENSCMLAREALCNRDLDAAKKIPIQDKEIDSLYRQIEVDCTTLLSLEAPVTQDLRLVSAFMQMVRDLERIGDYTKSIGNSAIKLFPYPVHDCMQEIETMLDRCRSMVALCLRSLSELDPEAGIELKHKDDVVDDDYDRIYQQLIEAQPVNGSVEPIILMVLVIRSLERIADHATNVGKRVTYVVTGERR